MSPRLTADFWVKAYLTRLRLNDIPVYVTQKGDATAGAILVKCARLDGTADVWQRSFDLMSGARQWVILSKGPEHEMDEMLRRQASRDPDLWILEIESREGRTLLDEVGLSD